MKKRKRQRGDPPDSQGGLFEEPPRKPKELKAHARRDDPETSHIAAASVTRISEFMQFLLEIFKAQGPCHDEVLIERVRASLSPFRGYSEAGIRSRRADLVKLNLVRDTGRDVILPTGRPSNVWEAV
jgi:hypothetical protein